MHDERMDAIPGPAAAEPVWRQAQAAVEGNPPAEAAEEKIPEGEPVPESRPAQVPEPPVAAGEALAPETALARDAEPFTELGAGFAAVPVTEGAAESASEALLEAAFLPPEERTAHPAPPAEIPPVQPEEPLASLSPEKAAERRAAKIALSRTLEALLLVQSGGVKLREAAKILGVSYPLAKETMDELVDAYALRGGGTIILREKGGFSLATAPDLAGALAGFVEVKDVRLSRAAYETLAVIALRQPITKGEIERIRGVNVDGVLGSLRERQFIRVMGRKKLVGQPKLFGVGIMFFKHFGIRSLRELRDYAVKLKTLEGQEELAEGGEALATLGTLMGDIAIAAPGPPGEEIVSPPVPPPPDPAHPADGTEAAEGDGGSAAAEGDEAEDGDSEEDPDDDL